MGRPGTNIRLSEAGRAALDKLAADWGVTRSDVVRLILASVLNDPRQLAAVRARMLAEVEP